MACGAAERSEIGGLENAAAVVHNGVDGDASGSVFDRVHADIHVDPVHALNRNALEVFEGVAADRNAVERVVENAGVGAYRSRNVVEYAVLNEDVSAVQILGAAVYNVLWMKDIELDSLVAVVTRGENLIAEGAARGGEAVAAGDLHHMTLFFVDDGDVLHREVPCVRNLQNGIFAVVAVEGSADEPDVSVLIAHSARVYAVLAADAEHVACLRALQRNAAEVERGVVKDMQTAVEVVGASRDLYGYGIGSGSLVFRLIKRGLDRPQCPFAQIRGAYVYHLSAGGFVGGCRGGRCSG